jgi:hypothetical protein
MHPKILTLDSGASVPLELLQSIGEFLSIESELDLMSVQWRGHVLAM